MMANPLRTLLTALLTAATCLTLAYGIVGVGLYVCTTPAATAAVGNTFSNWDRAVYPKEDMAALAEATRSFSIEGTAAEDLFALIGETIARNNPALAAALEKGSLEGADASALNQNALETALESGNAGSLSLAAIMEEYSLPADALSHLKDCTPIFTTARISIGVIGFVGLAGLVALWILCGRRRAGATMMAAGAVVLLLLLGLASWAMIDFDGLFTAMHTVLFAQGNWTFSYDSLLIQMFPEAFWAAMAGLWILVSVGCAALFLLVGKILSR